MRRRDLLRYGVVAAAPLLPSLRAAQGQEGQEGQTGQEEQAPGLYDPSRVGRPRDRSTDYENDPFIIDVESRLRCTCGCNLDVYTCRTTDFTCGTSPAMHREVVRLVEQGRTAEEILDAFIAQHGEMVLMAPKKEGFNLAAYFVPGAAISVVGATLLWVLARRRAVVAVPAAAHVASADQGGAAQGLTEAEQQRLDDELRGLEQ